MTLFRHTMAEAARLSKLFVPALTFLLFAAPATASTSIQQIIDTAEAFLEQQTQNYLADSAIDARYEVSISRLDQRLRMNACSEELTASLENTRQVLGRVTLRVRCDGDAPWSVFVPGQVNLYRDVVVTTRPIKRNSILQASDLALAERDVGNLNQGYLLQTEEAIGSLSTRALQHDQVVAPNQLRLPAAIKRGDQVVISAVSGSVRVRMPGQALSDGALGEQIRVRNTRSQRTVHARVTGPGQVEVGM